MADIANDAGYYEPEQCGIAKVVCMSTLPT